MYPVIGLTHAEWAINLVLRDIASFTKRLDGGDVGSGDDARQGKLVTILRDYILNPIPESYKVIEAMRANGLVPIHYLQKRTGQVPAFSSHPFKANRALEETLTAMTSAGYLMEVDKAKVGDAYNFHGRAYRIVSLPERE